MVQHNFKVGDVVAVINSTLNGTFIVEGRATVEKLLPSNHMYDVSFGPYDGVVQRFVNPDWQDDPEGFVAGLNTARKKS